MGDAPARDDAANGAIEAVMQIARERIGPHRYGGMWLERGERGLYVCVVDPTEDEIDAIRRDVRALETHWALTIVAVRYSYEQLIGFARSISSADPPGDGVWSSLGPDARTNSVRLELRRADPEAIAFARSHVPADALRFEFIDPGSRDITL